MIDGNAEPRPQTKPVKAHTHIARVDRSPIADDHASYVVPASELVRFKLGGERVDIRRWPVFAADGRWVGSVDKLMVDTVSHKIRYISVSLISSAVHDYRPVAIGSVLVPIGVVRRLDDCKAIKLSMIKSSSLARAPRLRRRAVTRGDEDEALGTYEMSTSRQIHSADFYKRPEFDESSLSR
ncbi:MAG TPA: PRC-barrel domain-containing protein [Gemmatimonadaceae bacterium]|nr:PRC-barrel domain-containing protein [Gemmatimonadaceae bacterium]